MTSKIILLDQYSIHTYYADSISLISTTITEDCNNFVQFILQLEAFRTNAIL